MSHILLVRILCYYRSQTQAISGLCDVHERGHSVAVTFNVIVPLEHWLWDEHSEVFLRFSDPKLGSWKHDIGAFLLHR